MHQADIGINLFGKIFAIKLFFFYNPPEKNIKKKIKEISPDNPSKYLVSFLDS